MERTEPSGGNRLADQEESDLAISASVIAEEDVNETKTDRGCDNNGEGGGGGDGKEGDDDDGSGDDDDCLLFPETPEDDLDEAHEAQCRRAYVAACGPGVPVFLAGARPRADKGWAWLLAAASGAPARGQTSVGRIDYGPHRFYVGDVDARGLPEGYGAVVHTRPDAFGPKKNVAALPTGANASVTSCRWPAPWALLKWHEGFWRAGQREGDGVSVCLEYKVATEGRWRCDLLDGHGVRTYGRGRWTLLPDGSGRGRWSDGDLWCHRGHWRDGERHGTGVLTVAGYARPLNGVWVRGVLAGNVREPVYCGPPPSRP
ncbi:Morn repeat incomplete domain containing protein [Pandoravirus quercus]|uniref:Morn repeat incomplete domain containing protein n=1 Tax=Pandoravirus quercus TaxID=2107709 RepID=A0A2U7U7Z3_9VIRU|nr:Morn repeat incomplete domain containing protein [Pandoravirus quercus]AVK74537.1 Morn repeat incomplete domain containing protein [Pandoravirus quercus]